MISDLDNKCDIVHPVWSIFFFGRVVVVVTFANRIVPWSIQKIFVILQKKHSITQKGKLNFRGYSLGQSEMIKRTTFYEKLVSTTVPYPLLFLYFNIHWHLNNVHVHAKIRID